MASGTYQLNRAPQPESQTMYAISPTAAADTVAASVLTSLIPTYLEDSVAHGIAPSTRDIYWRQLAPFVVWWNENGPAHDWQLSYELLRQYPRWLFEEHEFAAATVETYAQRVRQLMKWLYKSGRLPIDISQWIPRGATGKPRTRILTPDEISRLFGAIAGGYRVRNLALLAFLLETGARRIEAANVRWQDLEFPERWRGYAYLPRVKGYMLTDKTRTVAFGTVTGKLVQLHRVLQEPSDDPRVFRVSNVGIKQVVVKLAAKTQIDFSAHDLRRTFATHWMRHCEAVNPSLAEQLLDLQLGHSNPSITRQHYVVLSHVDVLQHYVSPLDGLTIPGLNLGA